MFSGILDAETNDWHRANNDELFSTLLSHTANTSLESLWNLPPCMGAKGELYACNDEKLCEGRGVKEVKMN